MRSSFAGDIGANRCRYGANKAEQLQSYKCVECSVWSAQKAGTFCLTTAKHQAADAVLTSTLKMYIVFVTVLQELSRLGILSLSCMLAKQAHVHTEHQRGFEG